MEPFVLAIGNVKGGVAKTTTAVQTALWAAHRGVRTLLVDADPGRSSLSWATRAEGWPHDVAPVVAHPTPDLPRRLAGLARGYELVVIDTPHDPTGGAQVGPALASAIAVADLLVVPTPPAAADLDRLGDLLAAVEREQARRDLRWLIVLTRVDLRRRTLAGEVQMALIARHLPVLLDASVPERASVEDAFGTAERLVEYEALVDELLAQVDPPEVVVNVTGGVL
jgi:chromosome partitioning protein